MSLLLSSFLSLFLLTSPSIAYSAEAPCAERFDSTVVAAPAWRRLVFLGGPGSGKGTHASRLGTFMGVPHISSGQVLRDEVAARTALGELVRPFLERGEIIPDDSPVMPLFLARLAARLAEADCREGFILDGFPRTVEQAKLLEDLLARDGLAIDRVVSLEAPEDVLMKRLLGRGRGDDTFDVIANRLALFTRLTVPLIEYYAAQDQLTRVESTGSVESVQATLRESLR